MVFMCGGEYVFIVEMGVFECPNGMAAGDHRSPLRVVRRQRAHGRNKPRSPAHQRYALSVTVNRATSPGVRGFKRSQKFVLKRNNSHCRDRRPRLSE